MPVTKGKKKSKRVRRRLGMLGGGEEFDDTAASPVPRKQVPAKPIMRRGFQAPLWLNATIGVAMLLFGVSYFVVNGTGKGGESLLLLVAYLAIGGFYIARAVRQFIAKRGAE